jgi:putative PEP-CTERM system histidine kinase
MTATSSLLYAGCTAVCILWAALVLGGGRHGRTTWLLALCCVVMAAWAGAVALLAEAPMDGTAGALELARSGVWLALLLHLHGREAAADASPVRLLAWIGTAGALGLLALLPWPGVLSLPSLGSPPLVARIGLAVLIVLLAENVYRNAGEAARWHVNLPCIAIGGLGAFDLVVYADAVLSRTFSPALLDARAVLTALAGALLAVAARRDRRWRGGLAVSRQAVFHAATLVVSGTFLLGVGVAGEALRQAGSGWGQAAQVSLLAGGAMALVVALASRSARSRIRHFLVDPFFSARYDYRSEWMRCITVLSAPDDEASAPVRAVRAVADAVDSPGGVLLLREPGEPELRWAGSWNAPGVMAPMPDLERLTTMLGDGQQVILFSEAAPAPAGLRTTYGPLWLAVPLLHHREGVLGAVLVAPPRAAFALDAEVFVLLRALGREVALFLAERRAAQRLADSRHLQDYAARFAFVAHDVKNVSSQLTLLLGNAEENIQDPDFQRDMLLTVRASAARIDTLIARLRQPEGAASAADKVEVVNAPVQELRSIAAARGGQVELECEAHADTVLMPPEQFAAAVGHLLDNAAEASAPDAPVRMHLHRTEGHLVLDIIDRGPGMTPEFIRDELFRPLITSKPRGNGIGAWQARELLRKAGGDLTVLSRPGAGTTMRLWLPVQPDTRQTNTILEGAGA